MTVGVDGFINNVTSQIVPQMLILFGFLYNIKKRHIIINYKKCLLIRTRAAIGTANVSMAGCTAVPLFQRYLWGSANSQLKVSISLQ